MATDIECSTMAADSTLNPTPNSVPPIYAALLGEANLAVEAALLEALPQLPIDEAVVALATIIERSRPSGTVGVLEGFHGYNTQLQDAVIDHAGALFPWVRTALKNANVDVQAGVIEFIRRTADVRQTYLLVDVLCGGSQRDRQVRDAASHVIAQLTAQVDATSTAMSGQGRWLTESLDRAVDQWDRHCQIDILKAALRFLEPLEETIFRRAGDPRSSLRRSIGHLLDSADATGLANYCLRVMSQPRLRSDAVNKLQSTNDGAFLRAVFRETWLLGDPKVCEGLQAVRQMKWVAQAGDLLAPLAEAEIAGAVRLIEYSGIRSNEKLRIHSRLLHSGSDPLELAAFWCLVQSDSTEADRILRHRAAAGGGAAGELARREIRRREVRQSRVHAGNGAPQRTWRALQAVAPPDRAMFDAYWHGFDWADPTERIRAGRSLIEHQPAIRPVMEAYLSHGSGMERARALRMMTEIHTAASVSDTLMALLRDPDPLVRATAVSLANELPGHRVRRPLRDALIDADPRVQANAVEALDGLADMDNTTRRLLHARLRDPEHRVRANAVVALAARSDPAARNALVEMLESSATTDRLSAVWAVKQLDLRDFSERIGQVADHDPDWLVRRRAETLLASGTETPDHGQPRCAHLVLEGLHS